MIAADKKQVAQNSETKVLVMAKNLCKVSYNNTTKTLVVCSPTGRAVTFRVPDDKTLLQPEENQLVFKLMAQALLNHEISPLTHAEMRMLLTINDKAKNPDRAKATEGELFVTFVYDIPSALPIQNPSARLYRCGFRRNKSVWYIPESLVPNDLVAKLTEQGADPDIITQHPRENAKIKAMAYDEMTKHVPTIHGSLISAIETAEKNLREAYAAIADSEKQVDTKTIDAAKKKHNTAVKAALKLAEERLTAAIEGAIAFDQYEQMEDLFNAHKALIESTKLTAGQSVEEVLSDVA